MLDQSQTNVPAKSSLPSRNNLILLCGFVFGLMAGGIGLLGGDDSDQPAIPEKFAAGRRSEVVDDDRPQQTASVDLPDAADLSDDRRQLETELETLRLKQEIANLKQQLIAEGTSTVSTPIKSSSAKAETSETPSGPVTLDYWNRMNDIIEREGRMRATPLGGISSLNARSFLEARIDAATYAVDALRKLDTDNVDPRAVGLAESLLRWYDDGRTVAEAGRDLLVAGSTEQRKGAAGQRYQDSEREHSQAVKIINTEGDRIRRQLSKQYGLTFPPLK